MNDIIFRTILLKGEAGNNIESIEKTNTQGLVDTYTVTLTDGTTTTFKVINGKSIVSIEKTSSVGYVDTYTITYNDGSTDTFDITLATISVDDALSDSSTNPVQNKVITQALEDAQQTLEKQIVSSANIEPTSTASQAYTPDSYLVLNGVLRKVTSAIAQGDTISDSNTSVTNAGAELTQIDSDLSETNNIAVTAKSVTDHVKHVIFNSSLAGGTATQIAISTVLPFETSSTYTPIQGVSQNDGTLHNFYIQKSDNTLRYAETVPAGTYYFDMFMYSS